jgi:isopentenyl diphosphate isomerase/L-lactate dehydrogenase-like FMN-dependent dehydrogenase
VRAYLEGLLADLQTACLLCGARDLAALQRQPVVITGLVGEWCRLRGVDLASLANRSQP